MTDSILDPMGDHDGVNSSQDADVAASFDEKGDAAVTGGDEVADGGAPDSQSADVDAGFTDRPE
ncbi:MAG TPA: hypothetical protein VEQ66_13175 [Propionibacteriaceae bacterium]|nr:hypothetical protein [Propionibacteriaceae bacterium]